MIYTLMHKNIEVVNLDINDETGYIKKITGISNTDHLPIGVSIKHDIVDRAALNEWWSDRTIPSSRANFKETLNSLCVRTPSALAMHSYGLSLSDHYWIRPESSDTKWEDVNFFDNDFSGDIGDILFDSTLSNKSIDFFSPDSTSDGNLPKRWKIINGKRCLIKAGSLPAYQQPYNEVIASMLCDRLGIPHVPYSVIRQNDSACSLCEDFVTPDTELIPAWRIFNTQKRDNNTSIYNHYVNCCNKLGIPNIIPSLDRMIVLDYIIANEDRHFNNFGVIRNPNTLEWIGAAPIYDSGTSLCYSRLTNKIVSTYNIKLVCKPFKSSHDEQLKLVTSFDWIDFNKLDSFSNDVNDFLSHNCSLDEIDRKRQTAIRRFITDRISRLQDFANTANTAKHKTTDSTQNDVIENIAASYDNP